VSKKYLDTIVKHYEECLETHGDNHLGVDWPRIEDVRKRYRVMLDIIRISEMYGTDVELLDFGCGAAHLLEYVKDMEFRNIQYSGLDVSNKFISLCKGKFPDNKFYCLDILDESAVLPQFDFIIMNGVFTEKREMSFDEMWEYFKSMIIKVYSFARKGVAFNLMSKAVDWERDDLFHMPTDQLINFLTKKLTRNFIIRNDYGLFEFTTYIYK
jgi:hypothetical protein